MEILKILGTHPFFRTLAEDELKQLAALVKVRKYKPGQLIFNWGEDGGMLYLIKNGAVEISIPLENSDYGFKRVSVLTDGNCFGLLSFLDGKNHSARATAVNETKVFILIKRDFERFIRQNPHSGIELQTKIATGILNILRGMNKRYSRRPFFEQYYQTLT